MRNILKLIYCLKFVFPIIDYILQLHTIWDTHTINICLCYIVFAHAKLLIVKVETINMMKKNTLV